MDINTASRHNSHYSILQLRYRVTADNGSVIFDTICKANVGANGDYKPIEAFDISVGLGKERNATVVTIDAWVGLNDGIYNATVLTPVKGAPEYLASKGLSVTIPIEYEKTAKILGLVPLPGKLLFSDNQDFANTIVSMLTAFLLLVLFFVLLVVIARRIRTYRITVDDISIERIY